MSFIDSYKSLEKLCGEIYGDTHGLSIYIDEMLDVPNGSYYVLSWNDDLKKLKHYRWVRNQIVHEPGCTEENMCELGDVQWIDNFYSRILSTTDPLALYRKARIPRKVPKPKQTDLPNPTIPKTISKLKQTNSPNPTSYSYQQNKNTYSKSMGCITWVFGALLVVLALMYFF